MVKNSFVSLPLEATRPSCGLRARGDTYFFAMADALFVAYVFIFHVLVFLCLSRSLFRCIAVAGACMLCLS